MSDEEVLDAQRKLAAKGCSYLIVIYLPHGNIREIPDDITDHIARALTNGFRVELRVGAPPEEECHA